MNLIFVDGWPHDVHGSRIVAISRGGDGRDCRCVRRLWPGGVFQRDAGERRHQRHLPTDVCPVVSPGIQFPNLRIAIHRHHFVPGALNFCPFVLFPPLALSRRCGPPAIMFVVLFLLGFCGRPSPQTRNCTVDGSIGSNCLLFIPFFC